MTRSLSTTIAFNVCLAVTVPLVAADADGILAEAGIRGGLVVHVGCEDGTLTAGLRAFDSYVVHGLDTDRSNVAKARRHFKSLDMLGKVTAQHFDGKQLPLADNLVNLLVVSNNYQVTQDEMLRVLAPRGAVCVRARDKWTMTANPWPADIDDWPHFLHDATGNAVAHDSVVAAPKRLQWIGGPLWSRSHEYDASLCAMVSSHGRLFYIFDEGPTGIIDKRIPDKWALIARDAFSGVVLWKRALPNWGWRAWKRGEMEQVDWSRMRSQRFRLPVAIPRRLVASKDRVYVTFGYDAPVTALDSATGHTITTYEDTERTDEILYENGVLVLCVRSSGEQQRPKGKNDRGSRQVRSSFLVALHSDTGRRLWQTQPEAITPMSLAMNERCVLYHDRTSVVCLDAVTGERRWKAPTGGVGSSTWNSDATIVVYDDVVLFGNPKQLISLSVADGTLLWKLPGLRGFGIGNPPDLFVADNLVWYGQGRAEPQSITGFDLHTGQPARMVDLGPVITHGHHARCYRSKATDNYLLLPKRAVEFIDIKEQEHSRHNWVRGACRYGVLPCNGLLYSTPHPCFCYAGVKLGGFLALSPQEVVIPQEESSRVVRGPAYEPLLKAVSAGPGEDAWPMYRHDSKRSGATSSLTGTHLKPSWHVKLGGKLTQPVAIDGRVFVARVDSGDISCLDAATGELVWDFIAGGRIDSSPTYHKGRLIFGSADGHVYCLNASDGALAWKFRAAPDNRCVVAFGQVESAWPVHGSVLPIDDTVYCTAGRSSFLDGGIVLYGIDPVTGTTRYETRMDGPHPDTKVLDEMAYSMEGAKSDLLVTDGTLIYLFHNAFDKTLTKQPTPVKGVPNVRNLGVRDFGSHLFSNAGFLDDSGFNRSYWMVGDRWPAFNFAHQSPKAGQLVVFDDKDTFAAKYFVRRNMLSPQAFPATDGYYLVADSNDTRPALVSSDGKNGPEFMTWLPQDGKLQTCWNLGVGFARSVPAKWIRVAPVRIQAMVRTGDALLVAGPPDVCDPDDPSAALEGRSGGLAWAVSPKDGKKLAEVQLHSPPIFDGMSAAAGRVYVATRDGTVVCLGESM